MFMWFLPFSFTLLGVLNSRFFIRRNTKHGHLVVTPDSHKTTMGYNQIYLFFFLLKIFRNQLNNSHQPLASCWHDSARMISERLVWRFHHPALWISNCLHLKGASAASLFGLWSSPVSLCSCSLIWARRTDSHSHRSMFSFNFSRSFFFQRGIERLQRCRRVCAQTQL